MNKQHRKAGLATLFAFCLLAGCAMPETKETATTVDGTQIEWAFTKADQHPEEKLINLIASAKQTLDIAIYSFTKEEIAQAIIDAHKRGVAVRVITDHDSSSNKSQKANLKKVSQAGIPIKEDSHSGLMHLKITIADKETVTTGSYNYTNAASTKNDEVLLIIHDKKMAEQWAEQFEKMWQDNKSYNTYKK